MVRNRDSEVIKSHIIILEVQKRPCLYDTNDPYYGDRSEKMRSWEEVYACVVPGWTAYGVTEKLVAGKEVQKRWRSIRDSYTKAYRQGKCPNPGQLLPNSRRYQYHKQMSFLLKALQNKKPRYTSEKLESISEVTTSPQHPTPDDINDVKPLDINTKPNIPINPDTPTTMDMSVKPDSYDKECQVTPDNEKKSDGIDDPCPIHPELHFMDDKLFMDSLIPFFKKMNDDTRLLCRIEVLKIIRYALQGHKCFEDLKGAEDNFLKIQIAEILRKVKSSQDAKSETTQPANGSRPVRKRKTRSVSPSPTPSKKRGPGRPRKVRIENITDEQNKTKKIKVKRLTKSKQTPKLITVPAEEDIYCFATTINELPMGTFMKMLNLESLKASNQDFQLKPESEKVPFE